LLAVFLAALVAAFFAGFFAVAGMEQGQDASGAPKILAPAAPNTKLETLAKLLDFGRSGKPGGFDSLGRALLGKTKNL